MLTFRVLGCYLSFTSGFNERSPRRGETACECAPVRVCATDTLKSASLDCCYPTLTGSIVHLHIHISPGVTLAPHPAPLVGSSEKLLQLLTD